MSVGVHASRYQFRPFFLLRHPRLQIVVIRRVKPSQILILSVCRINKIAYTNSDFYLWQCENSVLPFFWDIGYPYEHMRPPPLCYTHPAPYPLRSKTNSQPQITGNVLGISCAGSMKADESLTRKVRWIVRQKIIFSYVHDSPSHIQDTHD